MPILIFIKIAATQLAIDCKIEQRAITQPTFPIEKEADCPNLSRLQRSFRADLPARIPSTPLLLNLIVL